MFHWTRTSSPSGAFQVLTNHYRNQDLDLKPIARTKIRNEKLDLDCGNMTGIVTLASKDMELIPPYIAGEPLSELGYTVSPRSLTKVHTYGRQLRCCRALRCDVSGNRKTWPSSAIHWFTCPVITPPRKMVDLRWRRAHTEPRAAAVKLLSWI